MTCYVQVQGRFAAWGSHKGQKTKNCEFHETS
jgi:hypothetical protein